MASSASIKRIKKELSDLYQDPPAYCSAGPKDEDIFEYRYNQAIPWNVQSQLRAFKMASHLCLNVHSKSDLFQMYLNATGRRALCKNSSTICILYWRDCLQATSQKPTSTLVCPYLPTAIVVSIPYYHRRAQSEVSGTLQCHKCPSNPRPCTQSSSQPSHRQCMRKATPRQKATTATQRVQ